MRNPDRIEPTIKRLETLWKKYPDLRLGQLILRSRWQSIQHGRRRIYKRIRGNLRQIK